MAQTRTVHLRPASFPPEIRDAAQQQAVSEKVDFKAAKNPLDALHALGRDISILSEMYSYLLSDPEGRHGRLHVMIGAARRVGINAQVLLDMEENS